MSDINIVADLTELKAGVAVNLDPASTDLVNAYNTLLRDCIVKKNANVEIGNKCADAAITWLESTDFYTAPASSIYHEHFKGGLLLHTLKVYNEVIDLLHVDKFKDVDVVSASLIALVHDWCKIGMYEQYMKNVKDDKTGQWNQEVAYKRNPKGLPLGHGTYSMFLAEKFVKLTPEEACAINYHMGHWYISEAEVDDLQRANESFPLVHLLQFADQLSIVKY